MIKHVVLFKLKEYNSLGEKQEAIASIKNGLLGLMGKIDELKYIEVGENHELVADSFDICLITHFETITAMNAYAIHPEHLKVTAIVRQHSVGRAAVDFEF